MHAVKHPDIEEQVLELSENSAPGALYFDLRLLSLRLLGKEYRKDELLEGFEHVREVLRERDQEDAEDIVLEVIDDLVGWGPLLSRII